MGSVLRYSNMGDRISRSIQVARESYAVLRGNPSLAIFPVLSAIGAIVVSIPFLVPIILTLIGQQTSKHPVAFDTLHWVLTAGLYFANYFVAIFFNTALVACANEELNGRKATVAFGVESAMKRLPQILGWALLASTIGMVLRTISERMGIIGTLVTSLIGMVWNLAVYFVVPSLALEGVGPIEAVKTSTAMIKRTWGESIMLGVGMGTVTGLLILASLIPFGIGIGLLIAQQFILGAAMLVLGLVYIVGVTIVASSMTTIFQTALFIYCRTGVVPNGFQSASIQGAFREKPVRTVFGRRI